jgi:dihydroorotate dehydrogenase
VKRYRRLLDQGPPLPPPQDKPDEPKNADKPASGLPSGGEPASTIVEKIESIKGSVATTGGAGSAQVVGGLGDHEQKVIFATGGITNGKQALEILNAGASVAQVYTALIYGGVGTISRIKKEMREEIARK